LQGTAGPSREAIDAPVGSRLVAAVLALVSALLWGAADFGGGLLSRRYPAAAMVGWSQLAGLLTLGGAALVVGDFGGSRQWVPWSVVAGLSGALGLLAFYSALAMGTMGVVSPITALGALVPLGAGLIAGERPTSLQLTGIVLALVGAVAASGPELSGASAASGSGRRSVILAVAAGALFGVALLAIDRGSDHDTLLTMVGMRATSVTGFALVAIALRTAGGVRARSLPAIAAVGLADAAANMTFGVASTMGMVSVVSVLGGLYPVATVLLAYLVLHERMLGVQRVGVAVALVGVALLATG
jgi:drug/metabolite transporter (DMT)-like permease